MSENIFNIKGEPPDEAQIKDRINGEYLIIDAIRKFILGNIGERNDS